VKETYKTTELEGDSAAKKSLFALPKKEEDPKLAVAEEGVGVDAED
jgi:hypothetical protein